MLHLDDEQRLLVAALRKQLEQQAPLRQVREWLDAGDGAAFDTILAVGGWYAVGLDERSGGAGGALPEVALVAEELGRGSGVSGRWLAAALAAGSIPTSLIEQQAEGAAVAAWAVPAGPVPSVRCSSEVSISGDTLSGRVAGVLGADVADVLLVPAVGSGSVRLYAVDVDAAGVAVTARPMLDRTRSLGDVMLDRAPAELVAEVDIDGLDGALRRTAAVLVAADSLGAAQRMLDMTVEHTLQREQFGVPIGSFQAVKHAAATMLVDIEPVRSVVRYAAWSSAQDHPDADLHAAVAKAHATEAAVRVAEEALKLHGAIGFTWEHDLQLLYKRVRLNQVLFGGPRQWRYLTADRLGLVR